MYTSMELYNIRRGQVVLRCIILHCVNSAATTIIQLSDPLYVIVYIMYYRIVCVYMNLRRHRTGWPDIFLTQSRCRSTAWT